MRVARRTPSTRRRIATLVAAAGLVLLPSAATVAARAVSITTPYPAVTVAPGSKVSFDLSITTVDAERVALSATAPADWKATLHGGGFVIDSVLTQAAVGENGASPAPPATVRLDVTVPSSAASGKTTITVKADTGSASDELAIDITVEPTAAGDVTLTTEIPGLRGSSDKTFPFSLTLHNDTAEDLTFAVTATGPDGWTVDAQLAGSSQAASAIVKSGSTSSISVSVKPSATAAAGQFTIDVQATAGDKTPKAQLVVEITGSYSTSLTTPNGVLSNRGSAGGEINQQLVVTNNGTAPLTNIKISASAPTNWKVTYDPATIPTLAANGGSATVAAKIVPSSDAVAGDYNVTFNVSNDQSSASSQQIRVTIETSPLLGAVGLLAIVAVFGVLWFVFQRYGRR